MSRHPTRGNIWHLAQARVSGMALGGWTGKDGLSSEAFQRTCLSPYSHRTGLAPTTPQPLICVPLGPSGYQETVILWLKIQVLQHHLTCALPRLLPAPRPSPWGHLMVSLQGLLGRVPLRSKQLLWLIHFLCAFARYIIKSSAEGGNKAHH